MPKYTQFPRSAVAGLIPSSLDPGSPAFNWTDRKVYVGGASGEAILVGAPVRDFRTAAAYVSQDIVYYDGSLWRCNVASVSPGAWNETYWENLGDASENTYRELGSTALISGGDVAYNDVTSFDISGGTGVVMNLEVPGTPTVSDVSWSGQTVTRALVADTLYHIGINGGGTVVVEAHSLYGEAWRRDNIEVGMMTTDDSGDIVEVFNVSRTLHGSVETLSSLVSALGPFRLSGTELSLTGASAMRMEAGEVFWPNSQFRTDPANANIASVSLQDPLDMMWMDRTGYVDAVSHAVIDPSNWDNAGVIQSVPSGEFTIQFIFLSPDLTMARSILGQDTYPTLSDAEDDITAAFNALVLPDVLQCCIPLGAVVSDDTGASQSVTAAAYGVMSPFGGSGGGTGDTSGFLLTSGTRPMLGDLDLGTFDLTNGTVDGENVSLITKLYASTGDVPPSADDTLSVNTADNKIFVGTQIVSQLIEPYSAAKEYVIGDLSISSDNLYRCTTDIPTPEAFNASNWSLVGADNSGALAQAVILDPDSVDRNDIDLSGGPGTYKGLKITFDNSQSVDIVDLGDHSKIDRFGLPTGAFGEDVFLVSQASHTFTAVGTGVYFNGVNWLPATDDTQAEFPTAIVHKVIDANNVILQVGGRIHDLDTAAFAGGATPVAGTYYYASADPGVLTSTPGATPVPVLYAVSATVGIIKLTGTVIPTVITLADVWPVGSIYASVNPTMPTSMTTGMTWVPDSVDSFLIGAGNLYTGGDTGGSTTVTLTAAQMPSHTHSSGTLSAVSNGSHDHGISNLSNVTPADREPAASGSGSFYRYKLNDGVTQSGGAHTHSITGSTGSSGSDNSHSNMPPYLARYFWRRTA